MRAFDCTSIARRVHSALSSLVDSRRIVPAHVIILKKKTGTTEAFSTDGVIVEK